MNKGEITIHTLGPSGTNCDLAAEYWIKSNKLNGKIELHETLEKALISMQKDCKSYLLSCAV